MKSLYKNFTKWGGVIASLVTVLGISTPAQALSTYASGFTNPTGLAFDSGGNLFVANNTNSISKISGSTRSTFATGLNNPSDLAFKPSGSLYVADTFNNRVKGFNPSGSLIFNSNTSVSQPRGLAFVGNNTLEVTNPGSGNVLIFTDLDVIPSNAPTSTITNPFNPSFGIAANGTSIYESNIIGASKAITLNGSLLSGLPNDSQVLDLVFDQVSGNLYASDFFNNKVYQVSSTGTRTELISIGLNQPSYLAINGNNLYISDTGSGNILEFQLRTTPIPFEFNPTLGLVLVGGFVAGKKLIKRK